MEVLEIVKQIGAVCESAGHPLTKEQLNQLHLLYMTDQSLKCTLPAIDITKTALLGGKGIIYRDLVNTCVNKSIECKELQERVKSLKAGIEDIKTVMGNSGLRAVAVGMSDLFKRLEEV